MLERLQTATEHWLPNGELFEQIQRMDDEDASGPTFQRLLDSGLAILEYHELRRLLPHPEPTLTQAGHDLIRKLTELRSPGANRNKHLRKDLLEWSYGYFQRWGVAGEFFKSDLAMFHGEKYTIAETGRMIGRLNGEKLIKVRTQTSSSITVITSTIEGQQEVENESSSKRKAPGGNNFVTNIHGNGSNVAINSSHTTQHSTVSVEIVEKVRTTIESVREAAELLIAQGVDRSQLERHLEAATTLEIAQDPQRGKQALENLRDTIVAGAGGALGSILVQQLSDAASALGIF